MFNLGMKKKSVVVEGMTCHHCEMTVENAVLGLQGIKLAKADHEKGRLEIQFKGDLDIGQLKERIEKAGYKFVSAE